MRGADIPPAAVLKRKSACPSFEDRQGWLAGRTDSIEVFHLPSYAPELNPDERPNADLKHAIGGKVSVQTKSKLRKAGEDIMKTIERLPDWVKTYFGDPRVRYAA